MAPALKKYIEMYGDFFILDGTYNITEYGFILIIFSVIDCLGRTIIGPQILAHSEHSGGLFRVC